MDIRRGLFRLWLIASALWVTGTVWIAYKSASACWYCSDPIVGGSPVTPQQPALSDPGFWLGTVIAPPLAAGLCLTALIWIVLGFRKEREISEP